ncbi:MAG: flavin reductase family protein [Bacteroidota bacterium]
MKSIIPKETPLGEMHSLLLGAVGPRPIALASTIDEEGRPNLAPFSFFNVFSTRPPILIFSPARRGRDNTTKHTFENARKTKECVVNIVDFSMVQQMSLSSTEYPAGVSEFEKAGFTPLDADLVRSKRVKESPVQLECTVREILEMGDHGGAGNLIICEVVKMHITESVLDEHGRIDQTKIDLVSRMGGNFYCRAHGDALFEVPKPLRNLGVGVDSIPQEIRNSNVLTGNDLGMLGNVETIPDETAVNEYKLSELSDIFIEFQDDAKTLEFKLHEKAHNELQKGHVAEAWKTLLSFNN